MTFYVGSKHLHPLRLGKPINCYFFTRTVPHSWGAANTYSWGSLQESEKTWGELKE